MLGRDGPLGRLGVLARLNPDGDVGVGGVLVVGLGGWNGRVGELLVDLGPTVAAWAASVSGPGPTLRGVGGAGSEMRAGRRESAGCRSAGSVGPLGITGDTSGLSPSSPAHSESISAVSGALDSAREGRAASESSEGRERTAPSDSTGTLGGDAEETGPDDAGGGAVCAGAAGLGVEGVAVLAGGGAATAFSVLDFPALGCESAPAVRSFFPRRLIALAQPYGPFFPKMRVGRSSGGPKLCVCRASEVCSSGPHAADDPRERDQHRRERRL